MKQELINSLLKAKRMLNSKYSLSIEGVNLIIDEFGFIGINRLKSIIRMGCLGYYDTENHFSIHVVCVWINRHLNEQGLKLNKSYKCYSFTQN